MKISPRNEGTPSPRPPLANIQGSSGPLKPVQGNALETVEEASNKKEGAPKEPKPVTRYTPPAHFRTRILSNGSVSLTVQGQPAQATIEEEA